MVCSLVKLKIHQHLRLILVVVLRGFLLLIFSDLILFGYFKLLLLADWASDGLVVFLTIWIDNKAVIHEWPVRDSSG